MRTAIAICAALWERVADFAALPLFTAGAMEAISLVDAEPLIAHLGCAEILKCGQ